MIEKEEIAKISDNDVVDKAVSIEKLIYLKKSLPYKETIKEKILLLQDSKANDLRLRLLRGDISILELVNKNASQFIAFDCKNTHKDGMLWQMKA